MVERHSFEVFDGGNQGSQKVWLNQCLQFGLKGFYLWNANGFL